MSYTATSSYLTLVTCYHNERKLNIRDQFIDYLKSYNGCNLQTWKLFILTIPSFTKTGIPAVLKDTKEISMRHLILTTNKSRKADQPSMQRWIYLASTIPTLTINS